MNIIHKKFSFLYSFLAAWLLLFEMIIFLPQIHNIRAEFNIYGVKQQVILGGVHYHDIYPSIPVLEDHNLKYIEVGRCFACDFLKILQSLIGNKKDLGFSYITFKKYLVLYSLPHKSFITFGFDKRAPPAA